MTTESSATAHDYGLSENVVRAYAGHLAFAMDVGLVERARIAAEFLPRSRFATKDYVDRVLQRAKEWLPNADAFERQNGKGSMFNRNHPKCLEFLAERNQSHPKTVV